MPSESFGPMQAARKFIQTIRLFLAGAVVMYAFLAQRLPSNTIAKPILLRGLTAVAVSIVLVIFVLQRVQVRPVESMLEKQPQDPKALLSWRKGYIITYCLSLSIALYGLILHFFGFSTFNIAPFFIAALALILFFGPKNIRAGPSPGLSRSPISR